MAKLSADKKYVTVELGDTLSQIAADYAGGYNNYKQLAAINNIPNPDLIYVGQIIYLTQEAASGSGSASTNRNKATINQFGLMSNSENTLFATWSWDGKNTDSYKVAWTYDTGNGIWFDGNSSSISVDEDNPSLSKQSIYSIPSNAKKVQFKVKPISKTYQNSNDVETNYWEASWSTVKEWRDSTPLEAPGTPDVSIKWFKLTASLDNINIPGATHIQFQVIRDDSASTYSAKKAEIVSGHAAYVFPIVGGSQYKVRARAHNLKDNTFSEWSAFSANQGTVPSVPTSITELAALSTTSVQVTWTPVNNATGYVVEYTTKKYYFDSSSEVSSQTVTNAVNYAIITGMASGDTYFFRVKATNDVGDSGWTDIRSITIGEPPSAPTTWSSTTTAITGDPVTLYWVHNAEDGSKETYAELELYIGDQLETHTIKNNKPEDDESTNSQWILQTTSYSEGTSIKWRVRTSGITKEYGDWSVQRTIDIYAPATLQLNMTDVNGNELDTLTAFPFYIKALAGPKTQAPVSYHLSIKSNSMYETVDSIGNPVIINNGEEVYSKHFDTSEPMLVEFSAWNIDLENNIEYTVTCTVSMNSGLTSEASLTFTVRWTDEHWVPNASIGIDRDTMTANIRPYCYDTNIVYYQVTSSSGAYIKTTTKLTSIWGEPVANAVTTTGEKVYSGVDGNGNNVYYCTVEESSVVEGVLLSVYRREFDGSFTELATGINSTKATTITDPHPALDYARYRIVATTEATGAVSYYDTPGYPVGGKAVIIQWNEEWSNFETSENEIMEQPAWAGSMIKLPYNIDVSEANSSDKSLVEYIGRSHPVTYYGTQLGVTATWNMNIPKSDKETVYALRRLARWMGDVYVREPSGSGYWANISVSFSQKHTEVTIPVTLTISQVEGGM